MSNTTGFIIAIAAGIATMLAAYAAGIPHGADLDAHFRFVQPFYDEVVGGNWSPGWLAESNNGFGDARFRFYPPLMFYVMSAFRCMTGDWYAATLATFTLFSVVGCIGVYLWTRRHASTGIAVIAAFVFAFMPYHLTQFYQASLLLEFAVSAFIPYTFLFLERIMTTQTRRLLNVAGFAVAFALIVLTHVPTTMIAGLSLGLFSLLLTDWKQNKKALIYAGIGMAFALLLSSPFWIRVITELPWVNAGHKVTSEHYLYTNNFIFSPFTPPSLNTWFASLVAALTVGLAIPAIFMRATGAASTLACPSSENEDDRPKMQSASKGACDSSNRAAILVAAFALFMTTDLSRPIWAVVPKLPDIQFPFRWLSIVTVALCPLIAASLCYWCGRIRAKSIRSWHLPVFLIFLLSLSYTIYELLIKSDFLDRQAFNARIESTRGGPSFSDWLPVGAAELKDLKPMDGPIDAGPREVLSSQISTHHRRFTLAAGPETQVRIRTYYYPHWQATVTTAAGTFSALTKKAADGTLLVAVPNESCEVSVDFPE